MHQKELSRALDRLGVVHSAAIPVGTELRTTRCGEVVEQARHRTGGPVCREQLVATEGGFPFVFAAGDEDGVSRLVGKPVERALDRYLTAAPPPSSRARIGEHVGSPFLRRRLLRVRPGAALDCLTRVHHGGD